MVPKKERKKEIWPSKNIYVYLSMLRILGLFLNVLGFYYIIRFIIFLVKEGVLFLIDIFKALFGFRK
jgi:hypothetical protein